jgi:hypothetical protein
MGLFGGSSSASNDPFAMFAAMQQAQAAQAQTQLGSDWLGFAKQAYADSLPRQQALDELTGRVTEQQLADAARASQWAGEDRERWKSIFQPLENRFIERANNWDSAESQAKAAEEARADVLANSAMMRDANQRQMAARGINPNSGAWAGIDRAQAQATALNAAGAANNARNQLRTQAVALQGDALNIGRGLPSQALEGMKTGLGAGNYAAANQLNANANWLANQGIMTGAYGGAGGLFNNAGKAWGGIYDGRVGLLNRQDEMAMSSQNALLGGIGGIAGMGLGMYRSDERAKEDKREVKGILKAIEKMPVSAWRYREGEGPDREMHVGPMAQDFKRETGLGDGKNINVIDALGVMIGAVKELNEKVDRMSERKTARPKPKSIMRKAA